jgi:hypothetical protein
VTVLAVLSYICRIRMSSTDRRWGTAQVTEVSVLFALYTSLWQ